ncbi:lipid-A-disaccharide synthase N-terminal domain-containing protein [Dyella silvatica]|uniref:lipid-A-disaccharide synthase N-terminal domain-containing protein n=1 Tax=Dyella silvatica TaxID=2992128 RepID=UPI0022581D83|nr:lipid-A-disaccharide synthase N-terminal domain-containing protein [Dyella silvatica]
MAKLMDFLQHEFNHILEALHRFELTPWKAVGYLGSVMFTSRWFVQLYYTRKLGRVVMPLSFWWLSVCGSVLLLAYFIIGKNDSVGILSNFFPTFVSVYNLVVHMREVKRRRGLVESEV